MSDTLHIIDRLVYRMMRELDGIDTGDFRMKDLYVLVRALLEEVREPTEAMLSVGDDACIEACEDTGDGRIRALRTYQAMIDAALKTP